MIAPQDLKIDNLVLFNSKFVTVSSIIHQENGYMVEFYCDGFKNRVPIEDIYPIELNPSILEKCGFDVTSKGFYQHPNWYNVSLKYLRGTYNLRCNFMDIVANNIDYLHQLQNLYYTLTGEELIYNYDI